MGNLTAPKKQPAWITTPLLTLSLKPQELDRHRAWIAVKSEAALNGYWKAEPSPMVKAEMLRDWQDGLQDFHVGEIRAAFRVHLADNPKIRPNVGYIRQHIMKQRKKDMDKIRNLEMQNQPIEANKPRVVSDEQRSRADDILRNAGFGMRVSQKGKSNG